MGRLCERPGCSTTATTAYGFDADRLLVWLTAREPGDDPLRAGALCARHADAMIVPRGWTLDDRRSGQRRLFPTRGVASPAPARRARKQPSVDATGEQLALLDTAATVAASGSSDETAAVPWRAEFDDTDDLDGVLAARTPLLARAFRGTTRPR